MENEEKDKKTIFGKVANYKEPPAFWKNGGVLSQQQHVGRL